MQIRMQVPALLNRNFRARFHAWWEGYQFSPPDADSAARSGEATSLRAASDPRPRNREPWPPERIEAAQMLWGPEFVSPLGATALSALVAPLALQGDQRLLHVGCGLGGGMRTLVHEFGVMATGLEPCKALADAGMEMSLDLKLKSQAPISAIDLARGEIKPGGFDRVLVERLLHTVADKEAALKRIAGALKPGAPLLFAEFMVEGGKSGPRVAAWAAADPQPVLPWTLEDLRKALLKLDVEVAEVTDETERLRTDALHDLDSFLKGAEDQTLTPPLTVALKREVDLWLARNAALEAGEVKLLAIQAVRAG
jgi:SAM-dependent methyltransferase